MNFLAHPLLPGSALKSLWPGASDQMAPLPVGEAFASMVDPFGFGRAAAGYWRDSIERSVLYWDVMRERGNQYLEHMEQTKPNVLGFDTEVLIDGRTLPHPTNYELLRVLPPSHIQIDPEKRPFVVVDPRAGHGPGIGGFKPDSELGVALKAGHPCYFIGFLPFPEPGQTVEDVVEAEIAFLRHVIALHPETAEKPMVVGNCQAGWQIMMAAALEPDVFGPILIAGAPLSYWAGEHGKAPMRYTGGMTGGSWITALTSDIGNGLFDGAWLVQNFERLNPANTYWKKQYHLYDNIDTESKRYLEFERWWGGHVVLGGQEIQYIVDNLFVGNRLSTAQLVTRDGRRIDLRNVRSPVVVFCSRGDDITPPPQALGWIRDLYEGEEDIIANEQTIVYCMHDTTGHLGIFVSGSVSRKEHAEFTANMDYIDVMPPGLYETTVSHVSERDDAELLERDYLLEFTSRNFEELDQDVMHIPEDDRRFATVARISEINLGFYRLYVQPWVQAMMTPEAARWIRRMHPIRLGYKLLSDRNPLTVPLPVIAEAVRSNRQQVGQDNVFKALETMCSDQIVANLNAVRDLRDSTTERLFMDIYGQPLLQAAVGLHGDAHVHRRRPGAEPEHQRFVENRKNELRNKIAQGGAHEAVMRSVIYVLGGAPATDERNFKRLRASRAELEPSSTLSEFKRLVRDQFFILKLDRERALSSLPELLKGQSSSDIDGHIEHLKHVFAASGELSEHAAERFEQVKMLFDQARPPKAAQPKSAQPKALSAPATDTKQAGDQKAAIDTQTAASSPAESVSTETVSTEKEATQRASTETVPATNNVAADAAKEASKPQPRAASRRKPPRKR
ncbi:3-hydroxyalkanoate synthetase [Halomonas campaniensis]|nr:3-hydroxyalkanoate synthetase [Halomonas campaniensis]